jgi:SAM-dependent methyltransferase
MSGLASNQSLSCPVCDASAPIDFFSIRSPTDIGRLCESPDEAKAANMGQIDLCYCCHCEFVWNRSYDSNQLDFGPGYEFSLAHSPFFMKFIDGVAERLVDRHELRNRTIIEIGCGRGEFLTLLCEKGANRGYGFDPSLQDGREFAAGDGRVKLIRDYYGAKYAEIPADFVCSLSVLEDIDRPGEFLANIRATIGTRESKAYFEVFNGRRALAAFSGWSINYEQCSYWGPKSLRTVVNRSGFAVVDEGPCYGNGEYLYVDVVASSIPEKLKPTDARAMPDEISRFSAQYAAACQQWQDKLRQLTASGKKVAVWGTGAKGINFLNAMADEGIESVIDINPKRQGKFIPGSGHLVGTPESLVEYRPDVIVVTNPLYSEEIRQQVADLGLACRFLPA